MVHPFNQTPHYAEFLGELSFSSFKELGCETILLVEGTTDVKTFQQLLRLWHKEHTVVILPLGGDSLAKGGMEHELGELTRLSRRIVAVVDSERNGPSAPPSARRAAFETTCKGLGIAVCLTERRAIENYLTDAAIKEIEGMKYGALAPYEELKSSAMPWRKHENWRIAAKMSLDDIKDTDIGRFLSSL